MINFIYVYRIRDCKEVIYISLQSFLYPRSSAISIVSYSFIYEFNGKMAQISIALNGRFKVLSLSYLSKSVKI